MTRMGILKALSEASNVLRNYKGSMNLNELSVFLTVALHPDISINEISKETGIPQGSVSRHILKLSDGHNTAPNKGLGLVKRYKDSENLLITRAVLTERGTGLVDSILFSFKRENHESIPD